MTGARERPRLAAGVLAAWVGTACLVGGPGAGHARESSHVGDALRNHVTDYQGLALTRGSPLWECFEVLRVQARAPRANLFSQLASHPRRPRGTYVLMEMVIPSSLRHRYAYTLIEDGSAIHGLLNGRSQRQPMGGDYSSALSMVLRSGSGPRVHSRDRVLEGDCAFVTVLSEDATVQFGIYPVAQYEADLGAVPWDGPEMRLVRALKPEREGVEVGN